MNYVDVPYEIFGDLANEINIDFITELCTWLSKNDLVTKFELYQMGLNTYEVNKHSEIARKLSTFGTLKDLYLFQVNEFMGFFDQNALYRVKYISDSNCVVGWKHNPEVCDILKRKYISSLQVETYQMGVAASFPLFLGLPASKVRMTSSLHVGDQETCFEVDFTEASAALKNKQQIRICSN